MVNKDSKVVGIGLAVIIVIVAAIVFANNEYLNQVTKNLDSLEAIILEKTIEIKKLTKELKVKEGEIAGLKVIVDDIKKKLENVRVETSAAVKAPVAVPAEAGKK